MKTRRVLSMAMLNVVMAWRIKIAFFFTFLFPMGFFFIYFGLFARANPYAVASLMGALVSLSVISNSLFGLSIQLVVMRERDMLRRYHLAPVTAGEIVASRLLSMYLLFIPVVALQYALAVWLYHMPMAGSLFGLWLVFTLGYLSMGGIGLVVAGVVNTMQEAQVLNQILFFVLLFLSGTTIPLSELSHVLVKLSLFLPPTLMIVAAEGIMTHGQSTAQHLPELIGLALITVSSLWLATSLFRWEKDEKVTRRGRMQALLALIPIIVVGVWLNNSSSFRTKNMSVLREMTPVGAVQTPPAARPALVRRKG